MDTSEFYFALTKVCVCIHFLQLSEVSLYYSQNWTFPWISLVPSQNLPSETHFFSLKETYWYSIHFPHFVLSSGLY